MKNLIDVYPLNHLFKCIDKPLKAVILNAGAEDEASELYGDAAVVNLQQQHQQLNWEIRTQTSAPASLSMDQFDAPSVSHSLLRASTSSGSPKVSRLASAVTGEETALGGSSSAAGPGVPNASTFADNLSFVTPTGGSSQVHSASLDS